MKYNYSALSIGLIILLVCIVGCTSTAPPTSQITKSPSSLQATPTPNPENKLSTIEPSEMALQLSDVPPDFTIKERSERTRSDVDKSAIAMGWKKGYYVEFKQINVPTQDSVAIIQKISVYPLNNINQLLTQNKTDLNNITAAKKVQVAQLSDPKIGDSSQAFWVRSTDPNTPYLGFVIGFVKKDVYELIAIGGTSANYQTLKDIANKAAAKIK